MMGAVGSRMVRDGAGQERFLLRPFTREVRMGLVRDAAGKAKPTDKRRKNGEPAVKVIAGDAKAWRQAHDARTAKRRAQLKAREAQERTSFSTKGELRGVKTPEKRSGGKILAMCQSVPAAQRTVRVASGANVNMVPTHGR